ncbi:ABC transporter permease [Planctomycetota bacterium]
MKALSRTQQVSLLWELVRVDFKLRDQGTFFGFLWTLLKPILTFVVLYAIFNKAFANQIDNYAFYILVGIVQWSFFDTATSHAINSFDSKSHIIGNFRFPSWIVPSSAVGTVFLSYVIECGLVLFILGICGWIMFSGIHIFLLFILLNLGVTWSVSIILANLHRLYRDTEHVWALLIRIGFVATPIFYPISFLNDDRLFWMRLNPFYHLLNSTRQVLSQGALPNNQSVTFLIGTIFVFSFLAIVISRGVDVIMAEQF